MSKNKDNKTDKKTKEPHFCDECLKDTNDLYANKIYIQQFNIDWLCKICYDKKYEKENNNERR